MSPGKKARHLWHEIYYAVSGTTGVDFAMTCREATRQTDLHNGKTRLRYWLHLSLCQACKNYYEFAAFVKRHLQCHIDRSIPPEELSRLNKKLLGLFKKKSTEEQV